MAQTAGRFEQPRRGGLRSGPERLEIADVEYAGEVGSRDHVLHESVNSWHIFEWLPEQEFACRRQPQMTPQVLNDQQLGAVTGGEDADHAMLSAPPRASAARGRNPGPH